MYCETLTYGCLYMLQSFFHAADEDAFYGEPPVASGVVGHLPLGYMVVHEWIGKIITTQISNPFMLGSKEHKAAVSALPNLVYQEPLHHSGIHLVRISSAMWHGRPNLSPVHRLKSQAQQDQQRTRQRASTKSSNLMHVLHITSSMPAACTNITKLWRQETYPRLSFVHECCMGHGSRTGNG